MKISRLINGAIGEQAVMIQSSGFEIGWSSPSTRRLDSPSALRRLERIVVLGDL